MRQIKTLLLLLLVGLLTLGAVSAPSVAGVGDGVISGSVTSPEGRPAADLTVTSYAWSEATDYWAPVSTTTTDALGQFRLASLLPGSYRVGFTDPQGALPAQFAGANAVAVPFADTAAAVDVQPSTLRALGNTRLTAPGSIEGSVTGLIGARPTPLAAAAVRLLAWSNDSSRYRTVAQTQTEAGGRYRFGLLAPYEAYRLEFAHRGGDFLTEFYADSDTLGGSRPVAVQAADQPTNVDAQLLKASHLTGTVVGLDGVGLKGVTVSALRFARAGASSRWVEFASTVTDASGDYDLSSLPAGSFRIAFEKPADFYLTEYFPDQQSPNTAEDVTLAVGESRRLPTQELTLGSFLLGKVTGSDGGSSATVTVTAWRQGSDGSWGEAGSTETTLGSSYRLGPLSAGSYRVGFTDTTGRYRSQFFDGATMLEQATTISLRPEQARWEVNATLAAMPSVVVPSIKATVKPVIRGTARVGRTLRVTHGSWTPTTVKLRYRWLANGRPIKRATGIKLRLTRAQQGRRISVLVIASAAGRPTLTMRTSATRAVRR